MKEFVAVTSSRIASVFKTLDPIDTDSLDFVGVRFIEREVAETQPDFVQIIPYVVLANRGRLLIYERTTKGGDKRLHGRRSIGFGGHINPVDDPDNNLRIIPMIFRCAIRELYEETNIDLPAWVIEYYMEDQCLINENETLVDQMHLGIVYLLNLPDDVADSLKITDPELKIVGWVDKKPKRLENWSKIIFEMALRKAKAKRR